MGATLAGRGQVELKPSSDGRTLSVSNSVVDVVVIGGGVSGLVAARQIKGQGRSTTILEATSQLGGRCQRQLTIQNWWLSLGGEWMGKTHHQFQSLAKNLGGQNH